MDDLRSHRTFICALVSRVLDHRNYYRASVKNGHWIPPSGTGISDWPFTARSVGASRIALRLREFITQNLSEHNDLSPTPPHKQGRSVFPTPPYPTGQSGLPDGAEVGPGTDLLLLLAS